MNTENSINTKNDSYPRPTFEQIRALVVQWFRDRRIVPNSTAAAQTLKAVSEMGELADAVLKGERGKIVDGVGDVRWVIRERDEARAEVEKLKEQILEDQNRCNPYVSLTTQKDLDHARAEVERLQLMLDLRNSEHGYGSIRVQCDFYKKERDEARAEVERLKHQLLLASAAEECAKKIRDEARAEMERLSIQLADWELLGYRLKEAMNIASQKSKTRNDAFDELSKQRDESRSEAARGDVAKALLAQIDDALNAAGVPTLHPDTGAAERKPMLLRERVEWLAGNKNEARSEVEKLKAELKKAEKAWLYWENNAKSNSMKLRPEP